MKAIEAAYYIGYRISRAYKTYKKKRLDHPVISVGNLTLGGTGKTPAVIAIAEEALKRGFKPCVLTRGYKGKVKKPMIVSKGNGPLCSPFDAGDEAFLMAERLKGVEIIKSANRYEGSLLSENADLFIIDDGYQHWSLHRDKDILLVDSIDPFGNGRLFPAGTLREPSSEVKRADAVVMTRTSDQSDDITDSLRNINPKASYYNSTVEASWLVRHDGQLLSTGELPKKRAYAFCGIGNPGSFIQSVLRFGVFLVGFKAFRDHHLYTDQNINEIRQEAVKTRADWVLMTEKDLVKLNKFKLPNNFIAIRIDFKIDNGFYDNIFNFNSKALTNK
ncbi:MAG: tetraacyldisaccharide 4'-kinase [Nitrospirota bacterium]|nr:MAG: tetraacyldisaccharide 4'-kinase [Nitrospirota bacterium]